jgi:hypothetical protein
MPDKHILLATSRYLQDFIYLYLFIYFVEKNIGYRLATDILIVSKSPEISILSITSKCNIGI